MTTPSSADGALFVRWLSRRVLDDARGTNLEVASFAPAGRLWLGRLGSEEAVQNSRLGERAERLDPCAAGFRVRLSEVDGRQLACLVNFRLWKAEHDEDASGQPAQWVKSREIGVSVGLQTPTQLGRPTVAGAQQFASVMSAAGFVGHAAELRAELELGKQGPELAVTVVNTSPQSVATGDANMYEVVLTADCGTTTPFMLDDLPDSFRYDREVAAYGVNGGVVADAPGVFRTEDASPFEQRRPTYWDYEAGPVPDLSFARLASDPNVPMDELVQRMREWGDAHWSNAILVRRATDEGWSQAMMDAAKAGQDDWNAELKRLARGADLVRTDRDLARAFSLMNEAFATAAGVRHTSWRPFQAGFILGTLDSLLAGSDDRDVVDVLRFPTGGGKTETYLGLLVTAAFLDRLHGKAEGVSAWARFPLRMLSLQQTQRFADVLAAAELIRVREALPGAEFSVGFLVGPGTPNEISSNPGPGMPDPNNPEMPGHFQVLLRCPFCGAASIRMRFDQHSWRLQHVCHNSSCPRMGPLPFYIVDQEIFRFLPTVVVGTLDKAAVISLQAAMRGLYAAPLGKCPAGHGFTYARRSKSPTGCLFPGCDRQPTRLGQTSSVYPPSIRIQDELHLLRDSLGAVDAHYEGLLDHLQSKAGAPAKVLASSATIEGYKAQVKILYRRSARAFPVAGPSAGRSFWATDTPDIARLFLGVAPRGTTLDYAVDRAAESLQRATRDALRTPDTVAREVGIDPRAIPQLVSYYGTDVIYGSTLKDVEATARSFETQFDLHANSVTLTGRTPLDEVRKTLDRLVSPEDDFEERIHLVAASSMLSHGVDIDRLNVMVMLGMPLATAEFIQTTSRVGRTVPGFVLVLHKIGRERDHKVFRSFAPFVANADRLVDPVPITRRSRRVLELTFPGLVMGRILGVHEPAALARSLDSLTTPPRFRTAMARLPIEEGRERTEIEGLLGIAADPLDDALRRDVEEYVREFFRTAQDPVTTARFTSELLARDTMRSLRDVEAQVPVYSRGGGR